MRKFFKKIIAALSLGICVFGLAGCATSNTAECKWVKDLTAVEIFSKEGDANKYVRMTVVIDNPTIFHANKFEISWKAYDAEGTQIAADTNEVTDYVIPSNRRSFIYNEFKSDYNNVSRVEITGIQFTSFTNLWDTYVAWWIVAIVFLSIGLVLYGVEIFRRGLTADDLQQILREHISSCCMILLLTLVICLIPLFFNSWVPSVILLGAFGSYIVLAGALTALRISIANRK